MIDTDVLPKSANGGGFIWHSGNPGLVIRPLDDCDLKLLQPIGTAIRDLFAQRSESRAEVRMQVVNRTRQVTVASDLDVAVTSRQRRRGLLGRTWLPSGAGLWINPCESVHTWGMRFVIDLIYLDRHNRVTKTRSHVRPWRMSLCLSAHSVIELPAGTNAVTGTRKGDLLEFCCAVPAL